MNIKSIPFVIVSILSIMNLGCAHLNTFQREGDLRFHELKAAVEVLRDEQGVAYIYAANEEDLFRAQGFVTAQDRLFQMELTRLFVSGRISELVGKSGLELDIRMRTIGFVRHAKKHAGILNEANRRYLQLYVDGVNAFIARRGELPLEFKLSGIKPEPWTIDDSLAIAYLMGWSAAANIGDEIIAQLLVEKLGPDEAKDLFPLNINPDTENICQSVKKTASDPLLEKRHLDLAADSVLMSLGADQFSAFHIGSNNWVTGAVLSTSGKPVVANDPHLDARILPGPWYPSGLTTPASKAVGVTIPGLPGMVIGRTEHFAIGVTNSYADAQDLFIETIDPANPNHYMEGVKSLPFNILKEKIRVRDSKAAGGFREEEITIRLTKRGPVVSGVLKGLAAGSVITMRWSPFETMEPSLGLDQLIYSRSVADIRDSLRHMTTVMLNFVFADVDGHFGWQTTGRIPIRVRGNGLVPFKITDGRDNWSGWIPYEKMPQSYDDKRGWIGTCNHYTVPCDYPYYYSSHASASYRYRRLTELMNVPVKKTVDDHWSFQRDDLNLMAKKIAPLMATALLGYSDTEAMGRILQRWNYHDDPNQAAPAIFQAVYRKFFFAVYQDKLGIDLAKVLIDNPYFWQESLQRIVLAGKSPLLKETRDKLLHQAALEAYREMSRLYGDDPETWIWGRMHRLKLVSPIRLKGFGSGLLGGGSHAMGGSQETLLRGRFDYNNPFDVTVSASLRMVADLGDPDKVLAVLPGGASGRQFDSHHKDQIKPFMDGEMRYWWFSDKKIREHARERLWLVP
ncbi:MAG: penicillin acylase family protein [Smithellaceae bacterium]